MKTDSFTREAAALEPAMRDLSLLDVLELLVRHWKALAGLPLLAGAIAVGATYLMQPTYVSTARLLPPQQQSGAAAFIASQLGGLAGLAGATAGIRNPTDQYVTILRSRTVADRIIERFELRAVYETDFAEDTRRRLERNARIAAGPKDGVISIEVEDPDRERAARIANAYVETFGELLRGLALSEAAQRRVFFEERLGVARDNLARAESTLRASGVGESVLKAEPRAAVEEMARLRAAVTAADVRVGSMRGFLADSHPDLRQARQELATLRAQLARIERNDTDGAPAGGSDYVVRFRDYKYHEVLFELIAKQYEAARLDEARDGAVIQVIDTAVPAERRASPRRALTGIATSVGAFMLVFAALLAWRAMRIAAAQQGAEPLARLRVAIRGSRAG